MRFSAPTHRSIRYSSHELGHTGGEKWFFKRMGSCRKRSPWHWTMILGERQKRQWKYVTDLLVLLMEEIWLTTWDVQDPVNHGVDYLSAWCRISAINSFNRSFPKNRIFRGVFQFPCESTGMKPLLRKFAICYSSLAWLPACFDVVKPRRFWKKSWTRNVAGNLGWSCLKVIGQGSVHRFFFWKEWRSGWNYLEYPQA